MRDDKKQGNPNPGAASEDVHSSSGSAEHHVTQVGRSDTDPQGAVNTADRLRQLEAEKAALQDRLLRALAETENIRKRAERDVADARKYAVTQFAQDMTKVADYLERAIGSIPKEVRLHDGPVKTLVEGVELTEKELLRSLEKHGVSKLNPLGQAFDPNFHEAVFETEDPNVPHGTVTVVAEPGYSIGTRPMRAAKVGVSRGGPPRKTQG
ncbi:nucleotide exchange factor GrpE [Rhizobium sp. BR 314]|uniref:nucleotide exchange factor GrpE n=1 Tax=Rhizobium sp. BR 314 TaxID=3040013 RepID=UPI0039BF30ED